MMPYDIEHSRHVLTDAPTLSVLIPFFKDDPTALLESLIAQDTQNVEIWVYDDGSQDVDLTERVKRCVKAASGTSLSLITARANVGRSEARNALTHHSRSDWVLFLDADMRPQSDDFLSVYKALIEADENDIIFGGFTVLDQSTDPDRELHRALSEVSDCLTAAQRQAAGPQYVATSNLCVRKSVFENDGFDPGFKGWGWEDSEWAARVSKKYRLIHADNPAVHLGLETTQTLLSRFRDSAQNYVRFTGLHPDLAQTLALYNFAYRLKRIPAQGLARPFLKFLVGFRPGPIKLRLLALKLWRASWYAEALP